MHLADFKHAASTEAAPQFNADVDVCMQSTHVLIDEQRLVIEALCRSLKDQNAL